MTLEHDFVKYALQNYNPVVFTEDEFIRDLNKIVVLKKLFKRYETTGIINERLVLNNLIILTNVFGLPATNILLFYRVNECHWGILKTFLNYLNSYIETPDHSDVPFDGRIQQLLDEVL